MKNKLAKIVGAIIASLTALVVLAGCKSISFEKIVRDPIVVGTNVVAVTENIVRGDYWSYGLKSNLEGFDFAYSPTNGVKLAINKAGSDMSDKHKEIVDASASAAGVLVGTAAASALK